MIVDFNLNHWEIRRLGYILFGDMLGVCLHFILLQFMIQLMNLLVLKPYFYSISRNFVSL